jgi:hypothetical protein
MSDVDLFRAALKRLSDRGLHTLTPDQVDRVGKRLGQALSGLTPLEAMAVLAGTLAAFFDKAEPAIARTRE